MRILIDLQGSQSKSRFRGIGRYSLSLTKAILRNRGEHEVFIALNALFPETIEEIKEHLSPWLTPRHFFVFNAQGPVDSLPEENAWRVRAAEMLREKFIDDLNPDMVLVTSLFEGSSDNTITSVASVFGSVPTAVVLYDLIPLLNPERYIAWEPLKRWYFRKLDSLKRADLLLGISESASREGRDHLGVAHDRIVTISSAADEMFESVRIDDAQSRILLERLNIHRPFLMHSSAYEPRKNFEGLIKAYAALPQSLRSRHQLVLVCKLNDATRKALRDLASASGLKNDELILTGYVSDTDLIALYTAAHLFVFPSHHEGFGLPILEAMWCGTPAIGSNNSSIPEVIGREDALFDPHSTADMARCIERVLSDDDFYRSLKEHASHQSSRFSWDRTALIALEAFEKLHASTLPRSRTHTETYRTLIDALGAISLPHRNEDLMATAVAIDKNEKESMKLRALSENVEPLRWRIEGPFDSSYSLALLNRETARALDALGHFVILHSTEGPGDFPADPLFLAANPDIAQMHARVRDYPHSSVDVVSRNLYPPRVSDMSAPVNLLHHYAWEESGFPSEWVEEFNASLSGITCLSEHVEKILIDAGVHIPLATSGCGVDHWERIDSAADFVIEAKSFRFLHVSSCFPRKGVDDLLEAYGRRFTSEDDVTLIVKTFKNPHNEIHAWLSDVRKRFPRYPHVLLIEDDLSDESLKALYGSAHVLVSPSRAEGYGLPMAEAMLSGLCVITTAWGGQLDFCDEENSFLVDYRFVRAESHFNLFGSVWAAVDIDDLGEAMIRAYTTPLEQLRAKAYAGRTRLLENHTWRDAASRLVAFEEQLRSHTNPVNSASSEASFSAKAASERERDFVHLPIKNTIGWISTYNTKCGIATYSEHLLKAFPDSNVTIFAPFAAETLQNDSNRVIRCWNSAKEKNRFDLLVSQITESAVDTLIVQFNYGFFHFADFAEFLHTQIDENRVVVVMMHSTTDPFGDTPNWRLGELVDALARCSRILVHSVPDLNRLKAHGLVNNVALFPHGVLSLPAPADSDPATVPMVATYGFALPHKGLPELLHALRILMDEGMQLRLRFVTSEYPDPSSARLIGELRDIIEDLNLSGHVELHTDFLEDAESLSLLRDAELLVFAYQHTGESASGAVRYGFATGKPVAITPLSIFDDVREASHVLPGTDPREIAQGIRTALEAIRTSSAEAERIRIRAGAWRSAHAYDTLAKRLYNMVTALRRKALS